MPGDVVEKRREWYEKSKDKSCVKPPRETTGKLADKVYSVNVKVSDSKLDEVERFALFIAGRCRHHVARVAGGAHVDT